MPVEAEINLEFLAGEINHARRDIQEMRKPEPLRRPFIVNAVISATPSVIVLNSMFPTVGRMWEITRIGVFGADGHTVVASANADMYAGGSAGTDAPGDFASFIQSSVIPTPNPNIGKDKAYCYANDRIYAWIYGITVATSITLAGFVLDWRIEDRVEMAI